LGDRGTIFLFSIAVAVTIYFISMILTTDSTELLKNEYEYIVESLKVLGLFISGGAVIVNVYFAGRRAEAMEETAKATNRNADAANKNAELQIKMQRLQIKNKLQKDFLRLLNSLGVINLKLY